MNKIQIGEKMKSKVNLLFYISSFFIFILSFLNHYMYELTNYNSFVGLFAPVNESIFQHIKMIFYPILFYYVFICFLFLKKYKISINKWFVLPLITMLITSFFIISIYYSFNYGFNIKSTIVDIC